MKNLVSTDWLAAHLGEPDLLVLDASWHLPAAKRDPRAEFAAAHVPGAQFFDIDRISDTSTTLPHMLPTADKFANEVARLGANNASRIVCYDAAGLFSAARCWWMFKVFGHDDVAVLVGGLPKWRRENRPVETGAAHLPPAAGFMPRFRPALVRSLTEVATGLAVRHLQVADARSAPRFRGEEPEPRPGVRAGHMPGAANVHYASLLAADGTLRPPAELRNIFANAGIDLEKPVVTSCGSGVTAAILSLALTELGVQGHALYDGSWAEWGASDQPVATN